MVSADQTKQLIKHGFIVIAYCLDHVGPQVVVQRDATNLVEGLPDRGDHRVLRSFRTLSGRWK